MRDPSTEGERAPSRARGTRRTVLAGAALLALTAAFGALRPAAGPDEAAAPRWPRPLMGGFAATLAVVLIAATLPTARAAGEDGP